MKTIPDILLGFDFGMKRIGVAVGQTITKQASPLCIIKAKGGKPDWKELEKIVKKWQPQGLVIGIPLNMDGSEQPLTQSARRFAESLQEHFQLPIFEMDERLTSVEARTRVFEEGGYKALKSSAIDSLAAQLILENWIASHIK